MTTTRRQSTTIRNAVGSITKRAFAETFGVGEKQLERYFAVGMPHQRTGRRVMLPMPAARVWFHEYLIKKGERKAQPASLSEARMRKETAQAALEELKLARELGKLMLVDEFSQLLGEAYGRVRAKLLNFPARAAGVAFGTTSFADCQAKLHPLVLEIMAELAAADDVPDPDAETAPA